MNLRNTNQENSQPGPLKLSMKAHRGQKKKFCHLKLIIKCNLSWKFLNK